MAFTAKDVKALREKTGCGMMDCKKALTEADGDMDKAVDYLREQGLAKQAKKSGRIAAEGVAFAKTNADNTLGVVIEVNAETDFVAKNADFQAFVETCANTVMEQNPADVDALLACTATGSTETARFEGTVTSYIHAGGRIGVIVKFDTDVADKDGFQTYAKDIAMQIAAINPGYLNEQSVPAEVLEHEKSIMKAEVVNSGKPEAIAEKIVMGKIGKFYKENCLVDQVFVKDSSLSVTQYTNNVAKELGGSIKITDFVRYEKGEGLEKREDNFADEVASMVK